MEYFNSRFDLDLTSMLRGSVVEVTDCKLKVIIINEVQCSGTNFKYRITSFSPIGISFLSIRT